MKTLSPCFWALILFLAGTSCACAQSIYVESAYYGSRNRSVDVTRQVQRFARFGQSFRVDNKTFRVDPAPGRRKKLEAVYYIRGRRVVNQVPEGQTFYFRRGPAFYHHGYANAPSRN
jgi:hypothetical protein